MSRQDRLKELVRIYGAEAVMEAGGLTLPTLSAYLSRRDDGASEGISKDKLDLIEYRLTDPEWQQLSTN